MAQDDLRRELGFGDAFAIILAGFLATVSSANACIMASSCINLAMAHDRTVPNWLSAIHNILLMLHRFHLSSRTNCSQK